MLGWVIIWHFKFEGTDDHYFSMTAHMSQQVEFRDIFLKYQNKDSGLMFDTV